MTQTNLGTARYVACETYHPHYSPQMTHRQQRQSLGQNGHHLGHQWLCPHHYHLGTKKHTGKKHSLRLLLVNCKSVCNKHGRFQNLIDSNNPDVVVVTENWPIPNHPDGEIGETDRFCSEYQIHRWDRVTDTAGGGVFIAVKNDLKSTRCSELEPTDCELMWVKIEAVGEKALYVGAFYLSSVKDTDKLETLRNSVTGLCQCTQSHVWLTGDFNLPELDWTDRSVKQGARYRESHQAFLDTLDEAALTQIVKEPTREENTLDLFATNKDTLIMRCDVIPGNSDHSAVLVDSRLRPFRRKGTRCTVPLWKKADWNGIKSHIDLAWNQLSDTDKAVKAADELWTWFTTTLEEAIKKFVPHRKSGRWERHPWISRVLRRLLRKEAKLFGKKKKMPFPTEH